MRQAAPATHSPTATERKRWWVLVVLCSGLLIVGLDNTILNVALPTLVRDLRASTSQLQWIVDTYVLVFGGLLLTAGALGDRFGRKWVLIGGLAIFGIGSGFSAFAGSASALIATRGFMGIGAALIMPSTLSILTNVFVVPGERARALAIWSAVSGLGIAVGPLVGGWLLASYWWGSVFLVNVPIAMVAVVVSLWIVPNSSNPAASRLDALGAVLSISGLSAMLWGLIQAPTDGWTSAPILSAFAAAIMLLVLFGLWQRRAAAPMVDLSLFRNARFSAAITGLGMVFFGLFGLFFVLTQYLQSVLGYSALGAGLRILPASATIIVGAPVAERLVRRVGTKAVVFGGMVLISGSLLWMSTVSDTSGYGHIVWALLGVGLGMGLTMAPSIEAVMGALPRERAGAGSAINSTMLQVGGALGVAVVGSLAASRYGSRLLTGLRVHHVPVSHLPAAALRAMHGSVGGALVVAGHLPLPLSTQVTLAARDAFVAALQFSLPAAAGVAAVAAVIALLFLPSRPQGANDAAATVAPAAAPVDVAHS